MEKIFTNFVWEDSPKTTTALSADNLNKVNSALNIIDQRVVNIVNTDEVLINNKIANNTANITTVASNLATTNSNLNNINTEVNSTKAEVQLLTNKIDEIESKLTNDIISENAFKKAYLTGLAYEKVDDSSETTLKHTQLLHITDIHHDLVGLKQAVQLANYFESIDGILLTGDVVESQYSAEELADCNAILATCTKPYYPVVGNHDAKGAFNTDLYTNYILPAAEHSDFSTTTTYYSVELNDTKLIVLNEFETQHETYAVTRWERSMSAEQLEWLVEELTNTPSNFGIVIALHSPVAKGNMQNEIARKFSANDSDISGWYWDTQMHPDDLLCQIVDAYKNKQRKTISVTYDAGAGGGASISDFNLELDFSTATPAKFLGWIGGHNHRDYIWSHITYTDQHNIQAVCSSIDPYQLQWADMSSGLNGYMFNVETFDTTHSRIGIVRLGIDRGIEQWDGNFVERDFEIINI